METCMYTFRRMKASESVRGDKSAEPLIAQCYRGGGAAVDGKGTGEEGTALFLF